jgi:hypothetical protein
MNHGNLNIRNSKYIQEDFSDLEQRYASVESYIAYFRPA